MSKPIKSRTFIYEISPTCENIDEKIESLKKMVAKYHIIGIDKDSSGNIISARGFILFNNARTINPIIKLTKLESIKYANEDSYSIYKEISKMQSFWEVGESPKQSHVKNKIDNMVKDKDLNQFCNYLMNQNQQLYVLSDIKKICEENISLKEECVKLKKERETFYEIIQKCILLIASSDNNKD